MDKRVETLCWQLEEKSRDPDPYRRLRASKLMAAFRNSVGEWCCQFCGFLFQNIDQITVDHVVPLSLMKEGEEEILQFACKTCNSARGNMPITMFKMFSMFQRKYPDHTIDAFAGRRRKREVKQEKKLGLCGHRI